MTIRQQQPVDADRFNAFEAAGWERRADGYHRHFGGLTARLVEPLLDAAAVTRGTRLLDVASGPGYVAAAAAARGAAVVGTDVAHAMVELARRLHPGVEFRRADLERLPFGEGSFDAVTGNFALLHLGRPERGAAELARVLAAGGTLALSVWDAPERMRLIGVLVDALAEAWAVPPASVPAGPSFFRFAEEAEFARLLEGAGLEDVRIRTRAFSHRIAGPGTLWDGLLEGTVRTGALVLDQPEALKARIRASFERLAGEYATAGGGLELPVSAKVASARKPRA